jgi:hypothetical protein
VALFAAAVTTDSGNDNWQNAALNLVKTVMGARGALSAEDKAKLGEIAQLFGVDDGDCISSSSVRLVRPGRHAAAS